jgi:O-antigen/teichoic acid export membrane protein
LTPDEIGVQVLAASVMMLAAELKNFGIGSFLIRHKHLTTSIIQNTFAISMLSSFSLALILLMSANQIGVLFQDERVPISIKIISIIFFFVPFVAVSSAIITKNFEFKNLRLSELTKFSRNRLAVLA